VQARSRLKRMASALVVGLALLIAGAGLYMLVLLASAVAFSGSTGARHTEFFSGLMPVASALGLAAIVGWGAYFLNAVVTTKDWWFKSIALAAVVGGAIAIASPRLARHLSSAPLAAVTAVIELFASYEQGRRRDGAAFEALVAEYAATHQAVLSAAGGTPKASVYVSRARKGSKTVEYEVSVSGERTVYAIVLADNVGAKARFRLACITNLRFGLRDASKDACDDPIGAVNP
jgi:hypothetical protein